MCLLFFSIWLLLTFTYHVFIVVYDWATVNSYQLYVYYCLQLGKLLIFTGGGVNESLLNEK